jgi:hypothetical protein
MRWPIRSQSAAAKATPSVLRGFLAFANIERLLADRPRGVIGFAFAGNGNARNAGQRVFARH